MTFKSAIVFVDGNNWYHNLKKLVEKPKLIDFHKLVKFIESKFGVSVKEIRYYNSIPPIEHGEENYYKHMLYLNSLKSKGIYVDVCNLKKMNGDDYIYWVEKGVDVKISTDMVTKCVTEKSCDCCVLLSGDSDFIPVMRLIKRSKGEVITVSPFKGYSRDLQGGEFRFWRLNVEDLNKCIVRFGDG